MSIKTYPRVSPTATADDVISENCELCEDIATRAVRIEYNDKRSDDDVFDVCTAHYKTAHVDPVAFVREYIRVSIKEVGENEY